MSTEQMSGVAESQAAKVGVQPKDFKNNQICGNPFRKEVAKCSEISSESSQAPLSVSSSSQPATPLNLFPDLSDRSTSTSNEVKKKVAKDNKNGTSASPHQNRPLLASIPSSKQAADSESSAFMPESLLIRAERSPKAKRAWTSHFMEMLRRCHPWESEEERYERLCSRLFSPCPSSASSSMQQEPAPAPRSYSWPATLSALRRSRSSGQVHPAS
eukprot:TRINITY_DN7835_c0_g1_i1.p1 TRINITY_DN7835_c0_g1~~TRINITY_DN7835_c0_g1_i1.p1  ORF type:complete len:215 (-),score=27.30 TRINITY_DN7835_c0_g1_i1:640-1284(-)